MTTICLVRHGRSQWNIIGLVQGMRDIELSDEGREQAAKAGQYLKAGSWDYIVSSPLIRAKETATIIGEQIGISKVVEMTDLIERDWGEATGLHWREKDRIYEDRNIPGLEGWEDLQDRGIRALDEIVKMYPDKRIIVVSHGALIRAILVKLSNEQLKLEIGKINNTSINIINYDNGQFEIESYNTVEHLDEIAAGKEKYE